MKDVQGKKKVKSLQATSEDFAGYILFLILNMKLKSREEAFYAQTTVNCNQMLNFSRNQNIQALSLYIMFPSLTSLLYLLKKVYFIQKSLE